MKLRGVWWRFSSVLSPATDILNNLDPMRTGDLDDDDLMLDVDFPEDGFHDFDSMSQFERLERGSRHGQRRNQHHWNGPEHLHNDNRAHVFRHYDGLKASRTSSRPVQSKGVQHEYRPVLDELTLEHMSQDCNLLKNQLLRLKMLLQLEETDRPGDISEETEDGTSAAQLDTLMKEVQELREELRSRDKTIAQLTTKCQQLQQEQTSFQIRCQCHHQRAPSSLRPHGGRQGEKRHHYDKATQTHWRPPNHAGALPTPLLSPWQAQHQGLTRTSMPQRRQTTNTTAFQALSHRTPPPGKTSKNSPHRGPQ